MRIAVIQGSSRKDRNDDLYKYARIVAGGKGHTVHNLGVYRDEDAHFSYVQTAFWIGALIAADAIDFAITGCSSGQGMALACNAMPGVVCGYTPTPADAHLFGRINNGNAISYPLGLSWGWCGEINYRYTLEALFDGPFGSGYPVSDAGRKQQDTRLLGDIRAAVEHPFVEILPRLDAGFLRSTLSRESLWRYMQDTYRNDAFWEAFQQFKNI